MNFQWTNGELAGSIEFKKSYQYFYYTFYQSNNN